MPESCTACNNCVSVTERADVTLEAKKILSCVYRMEEHTRGRHFGSAMVIDVLRGSQKEQIKALGFDPIWFNVVLLINMELALITPPVGMNLFVIKGISEDSSIQDIIAGSAPFAFIMVLEIALLCFFPGIATWLPSVLK